MFAEAAAKEPQPDLHIRGDKNSRYERVAIAMAMYLVPKRNTKLIAEMSLSSYNSNCTYQYFYFAKGCNALLQPLAKFLIL